MTTPEAGCGDTCSGSRPIASGCARRPRLVRRVSSITSSMPQSAMTAVRPPSVTMRRRGAQPRRVQDLHSDLASRDRNVHRRRSRRAPVIHERGRFGGDLRVRWLSRPSAGRTGGPRSGARRELRQGGPPDEGDYVTSTPVQSQSPRRVEGARPDSVRQMGPPRRRVLLVAGRRHRRGLDSPRRSSRSWWVGASRRLGSLAVIGLGTRHRLGFALQLATADRRGSSAGGDQHPGAPS